MLHIAKTNRNRRLVERGGDMEQVILMYKETPVCEMNLKTGEVKYVRKRVKRLLQS